MPTYRLGSNPLVHAPGLIEWPVSAYAFPRDRAVILRVITETWSGRRRRLPSFFSPVIYPTG
jgi:hypothetical protein